MGVLGLTPFLQKKVPQVFKEIPNRLKGLKGKTIVIDGTLVSQRIHYSAMPYEYKHVLGWYRIVRQLHSSGVNVICVFDGPERALAKMRERERRQATRRLSLARESIEIERVSRLDMLSKILQSFQALPQTIRESALRQLKAQPEPKPTEFAGVTVSPSESALSPHSEPAVDLPSSSTIPYLPAADALEASDAPATAVVYPSASTLSDAVRADPQPSSKVADVPCSPVPPVRPADTAFRIPYRRPVIVHRWVSPYASLMPGEPAAPVEEPSASTTHSPIQVNPQPSSNLANLPSSAFPSTRAADAPFPAPYRRPVIVYRWAALYSSPMTAATPVETSSSTPPARVYVDPQLAEAYDVALSDEDLYAAADATVVAEHVDVVHERTVERPLHDEQRYWSLEELGLREDEVQALVAGLDSERARAPPAQADEAGVVQALTTLYNDFRKSVPKFRLPARIERQHTLLVEQADETPVVPSENDEAEGQGPSEHAMSRYQYELMMQESSLWDAVAETDAPDTAHELHVRSAAIAASYAKRNSAPTERTYEESRGMLRALGVPCLSSDGPHEGEAFAAALVHAGVADYVASEDTDVLIYEVPLLRGLTNLRAPLTAVSGTEVREALALSRAAFVDFALLLGTDFSRRLRGLGPMRAIALIKQHGSIETLLEHRRDDAMTDDAREEYLQQVRLARTVYQCMPAVSPADVQRARMSAPNEARVRELLTVYGLERAAREADAEDNNIVVGFGTDWWVEGGAGAKGRDIGQNLFQDAPAQAFAHAGI